MLGKMRTLFIHWKLLKNGSKLKSWEKPWFKNEKKSIKIKYFENLKSNFTCSLKILHLEKYHIDI